MKRIFNEKVITRLIFLTFAVSTVYTFAMIFVSPTVAPISGATVRISYDYTLLFLQLVAGLLALMLPGLLKRKAGISLAPAAMIVYALFLYSAIYLGGVLDVYNRIPHWDTMLHFLTGGALCVLGFSVVFLITKSESASHSVNPIVAAIFAICFATTLGVVWEIFEFMVDYFLDANAQRYIQDGEALIGQAALLDTMKDFIANMIGTFAASVIGYISLKYNKGWLDSFQVRRVKNLANVRVEAK